MSYDKGGFLSIPDDIDGKFNKIVFSECVSNSNCTSITIHMYLSFVAMVTCSAATGVAIGLHLYKCVINDGINELLP